MCISILTQNLRNEVEDKVFHSSTDSVDSRSSYSEVTFPCHSPVNSNGSINSNVQNTGHGDSSPVNSAVSSSLESERISSCSSEEVEGTQSVHSHISEEPDR